MPFVIDTDYSLTEEGSWVDFQGSQFLIAHLSNLKFQRALARLQLPYKRRIDAGTMDPEVSKSILCEAMAAGIVRGWREVVNSKGEAVSYSEKLAMDLLLRDPEFREFVSNAATNIDQFRREEVPALGKS